MIGRLEAERPCRRAGEMPHTAKQEHNGESRAFDHPYATVTKPDGTYEIDNVPAGAEVIVFAWHEKGEFSKKGGDAVTLKDGETKDMNFEIKPQ